MNDTYLEITNLAEIEAGDNIVLKTSKITTKDFYRVTLCSVQPNSKIDDSDFMIIEKIKVVDKNGLDGLVYKSTVYTEKFKRVYYSDIKAAYWTDAVLNIERNEPDDE
jgi:hypothetical protein